MACLTRRIVEFPAILSPAGREYPVHAGEDPHPRSVDGITGYHVWAESGEIGSLESYILDDGSWHIGCLDVKAGEWLRNRSVLIPTQWVQTISWAEQRVSLNGSRD